MRRTSWTLGSLALVLVLGIVVGTAFGPANLGLRQLVQALFSDGDRSAEVVVWSLRLPRVTAALLVGACLGTAGALLQTSTRNPLGDPQLFGVGGGATIVQALALTGVLSLGPWGLMSMSVAASLLGAGVISFFASRRDIPPIRLALIGVSVGALALAITTGVLAHAQVFSQQTLGLIGGSLAQRTWQDTSAALPFMVIGLGLALAVSGRLNLLVLGDTIAANLGGNPNGTRLGAMAAAGILGGTAVAVAGMVGFVGLMVPHLARGLVGSDARVVTAVSIPLGAAVTLYADQVARLAFMPSEVPVGLVTTALGAPLMIAVARRVA